jgi:anti-anti-sigma regulatory factor
MEFSTTTSGSKTVITIKGDVASITDTANIKEEISKIIEKNPNNAIDIIFQESHSISSAFLGYLLKIIQGDQKNITLYPKNSSLYIVLKRINLLQMLNVVEP